jgi:hypothetical protein
VRRGDHDHTGLLLPGGPPVPAHRINGERTGDLTYYLVPAEEVAGLGSVSLATLKHREVDR